MTSGKKSAEAIVFGHIIQSVPFLLSFSSFFFLFSFLLLQPSRSMEDSHSQDINQVLGFFQVDLARGLTPAQHEANAKKYGKNSLPEPEKTPLWKLILEQFEDNLVRILLAAAIVSFLLALFEEEHERAKAFIEPLVIVLILIANACVGVYQESSAEDAIEVLGSILLFLIVLEEFFQVNFFFLIFF